MLIHNLETLKTYFREKIKTPVFGAGVHAFHRLGMEDILPDYRILALRYSLDTKLIEKDIEVFSLEKGMGARHIKEPRNATTIISHPKISQYLFRFKNPAIIVYKSSGKMEKICRENNWTLIAPPAKFGKGLFEDKVKFRRILESIGAPVPPGKIAPPQELHYGHLMNSYGLPFVIQHPTKGGGKGTFFISNQEQFNNALKKLSFSEEDDDFSGEESVQPDEVIVTKFIDGPSPSITGCVTRHGVISTNPQAQILDIPELYNPSKGSGLFCGHDWSYPFSDKIKNQAYEIIEKVGDYFASQGYKGIFGIDFVMDEKEEKLYVTECNPRLLGSFPILTMLQIHNNELPILAFHVLEFLDADYQIDISQVNASMRKEKRGSQMMLHNLSQKWAKNHNEIKAGVYELNENNKIKFIRNGYALKHLKEENEFLITEGVPFKKSHFSPNRRLCRVISLNKALENKKSLASWAQTAMENIYNEFNLKPIKFIKLKKVFKPDLLAKG